ncbi:LysR family transcriptional regulator [Notoacmeibacter sp. MSK16QG-6]|uniref:LysR family transcriptional regulator n=1 Tax=Notoacmeibacter sp. MSK16QG-6 TaxID=2957982 RepID=UPI00209EF3DA|nr:LysR family transcriptional regulator [Notoacmeibacter sp. MSK16QG-6]MCP1199570.1 LysR family transcriptional regulator [Notoacmeibacter sp. MSK16QG-6]
MDLNQLRSFVTLARELHFGRAAQKLNMTQPPLSRQISKLEDSLGVRLFDRSSHSVELSAAGRQLLPEALTILQKCSQVADDLRRGSDVQTGVLKLGFIGASSYRFMPTLLDKAARDYPGVDISLHEMTGAQQLDALSLGEIDIGLVRPVVPPANIVSVPVWTEKLAVVLPLDNPLAPRRRLTMSDIRAERFVSYRADAPYMHQILNGIFRDEQVFPEIIQQVNHAQSILSLVSVGMGIGIVPQDARNASFDNIVFRNLKLRKPVEAELHLIYRSDSPNRSIPPFADLAKAIGNQG